MADSEQRKRRSPAWAREEIILVAGAVAANGWHELRESDDLTHTLSAVLRNLAIHPLEDRPEDFRSVGSISRKSSDIATAHSSYAGTPTRGGTRTREVVAEFEADPEGMAGLAKTVRWMAESQGVLPAPGEVTDPDLEAPAAEGGLLERRHLARERSPRIRQAKINAARAAGLPIACEVCGFDFGAAYGERGRDYIEVHHRVPLHASGPTETTLSDLVLLCSNCHRMIHRGQPWLTVEELEELVATR